MFQFFIAVNEYLWSRCLDKNTLVAILDPVLFFYLNGYVRSLITANNREKSLLPTNLFNYNINRRKVTLQRPQSNYFQCFEIKIQAILICIFTL